MDAVNLMVHVLNSIFMMIDLAIVGHPIRLNHAYFTTGVGVCYAIFSVIYFLAGGTNRYVELFILFFLFDFFFLVFVLNLYIYPIVQSKFLENLLISISRFYVMQKMVFRVELF